MTLKQILFETFFQRRFNVGLLFFNVLSTLKQRRCACWRRPSIIKPIKLINGL